MTDIIISSNTEDTTNVYGPTDYFLFEGITHFSTQDSVLIDDPFGFQRGATDLTILGTINSLHHTAIDLKTLISFGSQILIGHSGSVLANSPDTFAIEVKRSDLTITNHGLIAGGSGIKFKEGINKTLNNTGDISAGFSFAIDSTHQLDIDNSGTITSANIGIRISADEDTVIHNSGLISAENTAILQISSPLKTGRVLVENSGTISGNIHIASNEINLVTNTGQIIGDLNFRSSLGFNTYDGRLGEISGIIKLGNALNHAFGGDSSETFLLRNGVDLVEAGGGNDIVRLDWAETKDIDGGSGSDTVEFTGTDFVVFDMSNGVLTHNAAGGAEHQGIFRTFENYKGAFLAEAATIMGSIGDNKIETGHSDDLIRGFYGNDDLRSGNGNDTVDGGGGDDRLDGANGNDTLNGGNGNDHVDGSFGDDRLYGAAGNDILLGGFGNDRLKGNQGDDVLNGGGGKDVLFGGTGADVFVFHHRSAVDIVVDWQDGADRIDLTDFGFANAAAALAGFSQHGADVFFEDGNNNLLIQNVQLADFTAADLIL